MAKTKPIKERVYAYMEAHELTYRDMADRLEINSHSQLHRWVLNDNETLSSKIERLFNDMVKKDGELS